MTMKTTINDRSASLVRAEADSRLTFVMPVTLAEGQTGISGLSWRDAPDHRAHLRTRLALKSLFSRARLDDLREFLIVCPAAETAEVAGLAREVTRDERLHVLPELDLCPDVARAVDPSTGGIRGWYVQQMLKLAAARRVTTSHYITMDSDVVTFRALRAECVVRDGRALCGVESAETYTELYTPAFAAAEVRIKERRLKNSAALLGYTRSARYVGCYYSETPTVFSAGAMRAMCDHLTERHGRPWTHVLAESTGWTEHSLYFQYLEMTGELEAHHEIAGSNAVLHLSGSVWQETNHYRVPRRYDDQHFNTVLSDPDGFFLAIQSWLPLESWLPRTGCESLEEFYHYVAQRLGDR